MMNRVNIPKIFAFERLTKQIIQLLADLTLISGCFFLALWVQDGIENGSELTTYLVLLILLLTTLILFEVTGVNKNLIRFISLSAWRPLFISSILSAFILLGASKLVSDFIIVESVFIYFSSLFFTTMGVRFTLHGIFISYNQHGKKSIAVYGAGAAGREL
jgi:FlaA1/EpsC-like NDP-sugar epimerase